MLRLFIKNKNKQVEECHSVPEIVYCSECKHLVYLKDAQRVGVRLPGEMFSYEESFCPQHKKKYDRVKVTYFSLVKEKIASVVIALSCMVATVHMTKPTKSNKAPLLVRAICGL